MFSSCVEELIEHQNKSTEAPEDELEFTPRGTSGRPAMTTKPALHLKRPKRTMRSATMLSKKPSRTLLAAALAALFMCSTCVSSTRSVSISSSNTGSVFAVPRGGGWFGSGRGNSNSNKRPSRRRRNNRRNKNNSDSGDDDSNDDNGGKMYPALSEEEIMNVLNVPIYAITDHAGNGAVLSTKPDDQNVVYFFLSEQMARQALRSMQAANQGMDLRVSALHLGKVWFKLLHNDQMKGNNKVELTQVDPNAPTVFKQVQMRLVPEMRDLVGARLLQGLDPNDVPRLQDAIESGDQDAARALIQTATEKSEEFREPFNKIPVFMVQQLRMQKKDPNGGDGYEAGSVQKFPMFLSPKTMLHVYQTFMKNTPGAENLQPTLQLGELHKIVEMMQHESEMDFRNVVLLPGGQEDDRNGNGDDSDDDDDDDGGDGSIKRGEESETEEIDFANIEMTPYIEMGTYIADTSGGMVPLQ